MASFLCIQNQPNDGSRCIGSSHGWLILFNQQKTVNNLYLFNPSSGAQIELPTLNQSVVHKAVLTANPSKTIEYLVVVIYGYEAKITFFNMGRECLLLNQWRCLVATDRIADVMCHGTMMFALDYACNISVWDVRGVIYPSKVRDIIKPTFGDNAFEEWESMRDLCSSRWYVVECSGEILVVCRTVGEYVRNGKPIHEVDLLDSETNHPLVCPYKTLKFHVYRLDVAKNEYEEVKSIGADQVLFLGGNQSISISRGQFPECQGNSIYFTDDYWDRMDEDYLYGGHDLGVYSLDDNNVKDFYEFDEKIEPPPFWVVPAAGMVQAMMECGGI